MTEYTLIGFFSPALVRPTFLVPYFTKPGSNISFVQCLNNDYKIEEFSLYDLSDVPNQCLFTSTQLLRRELGDPGVLAVSLGGTDVLCGSRDEVSYVLRGALAESELPPFFRLEAASFLEDAQEIEKAIKLAAACFSDPALGRRWQQREQALSNRKKTSFDRALDRLKDDVGESEFRVWLKALRVARVDDDRAVIAAPTRFSRDWVATHYADKLLGHWQQEDRHVKSLSLVAGSGEPSEPRSGLIKADGDIEASVPGVKLETDLLSVSLESRFTFENFVVGKPNELAYAAARGVAEACAGPVHTVPFNPLFLYGGVGLGKTHLMHAVAWHVRKYAPDQKIIYLSAEKFMYQFIRALRFKSTMDFKEQFRSVDLLMVDDVQFIVGKESTQEEFFHTFNALVDEKRQIVISADKSPSDLEGMEERLRSRLGSGLVADLHPTTYELRLSILESKAEQNGLRAPAKVLEFLAHKITSNVRDLEAALIRIAAHVQLVGGEVTLGSVQEVLKDLLRSNERRVTIDEIQKQVAHHFNIRLTEMTSGRRARAVARPRQVAMYLAKQLTTRSLPEIGRKFGGRDHMTVMHAVRKIEELKGTDPALAEDVELLRRMLQY